MQFVTTHGGREVASNTIIGAVTRKDSYVNIYTDEDRHTVDEEELIACGTQVAISERVEIYSITLSEDSYHWDAGAHAYSLRDEVKVVTTDLGVATHAHYSLSRRDPLYVGPAAGATHQWDLDAQDWQIDAFCTHVVYYKLANGTCATIHGAPLLDPVELLRKRVAHQIREWNKETAQLAAEEAANG